MMFKLPPDSERWMPPKAVCKRLFGSYITDAHNDIQYLFFLQFKYRFIIGVMLSAFLWLTYRFDLSLMAFGRDFAISRTGDFVADFSITFCYMFLAIEFFCIKPFFNHFLKKIKPNDDSLFAFQKIDRSQSVAALEKRLKLGGRLGFVFLMIFYFGSPTLGLFWASRFEAERSEVFLIQLVIMLPIIFSYIWGWIFILENGYRVFRRFVHKRIREETKAP